METHRKRALAFCNYRKYLDSNFKFETNVFQIYFSFKKNSKPSCGFANIPKQCVSSTHLSVKLSFPLEKNHFFKSTSYIFTKNLYLQDFSECIYDVFVFKISRKIVYFNNVRIFFIKLLLKKMSKNLFLINLNHAKTL